MTKADNIKYSRHKEVRGHDYAHYDNYDAIEVPKVDAIPSDYDGVMGVLFFVSTALSSLKSSNFEKAMTIRTYA